MPQSRAGSTSSIEPGAQIGGFRVERLIARGSRAAVYEATQLSLDRRVALKLLEGDDLERRLAGLRWPEHPNVAALYAAGSSAHGHFVAMQLVTGTTLAELHSGGRLSRRRARHLLTQVEAALEAAHAAGIAHGSLHERNVLVTAADQALLTDFGLAEAPASAASDRAALAAMRDRLAAGGTRRAKWALATVAVGAAAAAGVVLVTGENGENGEPPGPPRPALGHLLLGSTLRAGTVRTVDCDGRAASAGSRPCTIVATRIGGRDRAAARSGVVRRWSVRGASGELALQVVRPRGRLYAPVMRGPYERVPDAGTHTFSVNLPIRRGDLLGLDVGPGAAVGVSAEAANSTTARWFGPLALSARPIERGSGTGLDSELLLRAEYEPGAAWSIPGAMTGSAARRAPAGQVLAARDSQAPGRSVQTVAVVRVGWRIVVDLLARDLRVARAPVQGADAAGRLLGITVLGRPIVRLRWSNPDGRVVAHDYAIGRRSITPRN